MSSLDVLSAAWITKDESAHNSAPNEVASAHASADVMVDICT